MNQLQDPTHEFKPKRPLKLAQKQRQAANHAKRAAENQRIRNDRNSNRK